MNSHTIPLPPNFIPTEYALGDLVEVIGHPAYNGIRGTVMRLPTSTSYQNGGDRRYEIKITGKSLLGNGYQYLYFEEKALKKCLKGERIEGREIAHAEVQIGDIIRVEVRSTKGGFSQTTVKEGRVACISKRLKLVGEDHEDYTFRTSEEGWTGMLNYNHKGEKITLVKAAENPYVAIVEGLAAGTVVVHERRVDGFEVQDTYVKSVDYAHHSQWHKVSSTSKYSSTFVEDRDIIELLNNGAEIVHKVRKPKVDVNVPF